MEFIHSDLAPKAIGPYSQAVKANGFIFCSGQIPLKADGTLVEGGIEEQVSQVLKNLSLVLEKAGSSLQKVVKTTVYLKDLQDFPKMNEIYEQYFGAGKPARATVEVSNLPKNVLIEMDCIAVE